MADPYQPPPGGPVPPTLAQRQQPYTDHTNRVSVETGNGGFGIGMVVLAVFVVVAVLAAVFFRPGASDVAPVVAPAPATIEPAVDPAPPVTDAPATGGTAPDAVAPQGDTVDPAPAAPAVQP